MRELEGKIVQFISVDKKYIKQPYPCIAPESKAMNTYVTGQHIDPMNDETIGNLSRAEMLGEEEIKPQARRKQWPYIINPSNPVLIQHGKKYNCELNGEKKPVNPQDYAEAHFIVAQKWLVAPSKDKIRSNSHKFYLHDKEQEAHTRLLKSDARYEAEKLIREKATIEEYKWIVQVLNLRMPQFYENPMNMTSTQLKDILLTKADESPEEIKFYFTSAAKPYILAGRLLADNILDKRHDGYYYTQVYLGESVNSMIQFLNDQDNDQLVGKLIRILDERE